MEGQLLFHGNADRGSHPSGLGCAVPLQHKAEKRRRRILKGEAVQVILLLGAGWCCSLLQTLESHNGGLKEKHRRQGKPCLGEGKPSSSVNHRSTFKDGKQNGYWLQGRQVLPG